MTEIDISFILLILFVCIAISIVYDTLRYGISPMPSSSRAKRAILEALPEKIDGKIYELGSGWGTLAFPLAKKYPHAQIIGYEIALIPYLFSRIRHFISRPPNLQICRKNFFDAKLDDSRVIVCYLYPEAMRKLKVKFEKELKQRTLIVSNTFAIPGWKPKKEIEVHDLFRGKIYIYNF